MVVARIRFFHVISSGNVASPGWRSTKKPLPSGRVAVVRGVQHDPDLALEIEAGHGCSLPSVPVAFSDLESLVLGCRVALSMPGIFPLRHSTLDASSGSEYHAATAGCLGVGVLEYVSVGVVSRWVGGFARGSVVGAAVFGLLGNCAGGGCSVLWVVAWCDWWCPLYTVLKGKCRKLRPSPSSRAKISGRSTQNEDCLWWVLQTASENASGLDPEAIHGKSSARILESRYEQSAKCRSHLARDVLTSVPYDHLDCWR